jgi:hypothetical protein
MKGMGNALRACRLAYFEDWWQERRGLATSGGVGRSQTTGTGPLGTAAAFWPFPSGALPFLFQFPRLLLNLPSDFAHLIHPASLYLHQHSDPPASSSTHFSRSIRLSCHIDFLPLHSVSPSRLRPFNSRLRGLPLFGPLVINWATSQDLPQPQSNKHSATNLPSCRPSSTPIINSSNITSQTPTTTPKLTITMVGPAERHAYQPVTIPIVNIELRSL